MSTYRNTVTGLALLTLSVLAFPLHAQTPNDVQIRRVRTTEFGGVLGTAMRLVPGVGDPEQEIFSIHGMQAIARTDAGESSTIMDYDEGRMIVENHEDQSFYQLTLDEMIAAASDLTAATDPNTGDVATGEPQDADVEYEVRVEVDRPGDTKMVSDLEVELVRMIVTATPVRAEDVDPEQLPIYVMVSDQWMAEDFPGAEAYERIGQAAMERFQEQAGAQDVSAVLAQAFQQNNALKASYEGLADELSEVRGVAFEHTMAFLSLMPGAELDLEAALNAPLAGPEIDFGKAARTGATNAVEDAVRGRLGRLGRFGRGNKDKDEEDKPEASGPQQAVIVRFTERTEDIRIGPLEAGWTSPTEGYSEKESPLAGMRNR